MDNFEPILTIGHSTHPLDTFIGMLRQHKVTAIADVRSVPYSQFQPQYNREPLKKALKTEGIDYVFLGEELGARSKDPNCYVNGKVQYRALAKTALFRRGLERLHSGRRQWRIALMCSEREPLECHRALLVARELDSEGVEVGHIHADGHLESHADAQARLVKMLKLSEQDLFRSPIQILDDAYARQEERVAYVDDFLVKDGEGGRA
jgi:uncharacterized protein (DUF488 family)